MATWNRLTTVRGEVGRGDWRKGGGVAEEHVCMTPTHRQQSGEGQREKGAGAGRRWAGCGDIGKMSIKILKMINKIKRNDLARSKLFK